MTQKASLLLYKSHVKGMCGKNDHIQIYNSVSLEMYQYFKSQISYLDKKECETLIRVVKKQKPPVESDANSIADLEKYGFIEKVDGRYKIFGDIFNNYLYVHSKNKN